MLGLKFLNKLDTGISNTHAYLIKTREYTTKEPVIGPEIKVGSFLRSIMAANGIPKLETGPQKCVEQTSIDIE